MSDSELAALLRVPPAKLTALMPLLLAHGFPRPDPILKGRHLESVIDWLRVRALGGPPAEHGSSPNVGSTALAEAIRRFQSKSR